MRWIIGDVHGMYTPLRRLLDWIHETDPAPALVFAGDYVNRGPDSAKVVELLLTLTGATLIRGNHDDVFDLVLHGDCVCPGAAGISPAAALRWFSDYGLDRTFYSYGVDWAYFRDVYSDPTDDQLLRLRDLVPEPHRRFIQSLPLSYDGGDFFVVHGYVPPGVNSFVGIDSQRLLWGRFRAEEIVGEKRWMKPGYFGHTPTHTYFPSPKDAPMLPLVGPSVTLIDTACAFGPFGRLTAACVETGRWLQVTHDGRRVEGTAG